MRVVFMGSPEFAVPSLQALMDSNHEVVGVYSQQPKPAGRGKKIQNTPVHQLAADNNIPVFTPEKLTPDAIAELATLKPEVICVAAYGLILPKAVIDMAPCINVHPSALPRWRGAAPLHHTILAGDKTTDLCIMKMGEGLDDGPVYLRQSVEVGPNTTTGTLHDTMAKLGAEKLLAVLNDLPSYTEKLKKQPWWVKTTYAHKFKPADLKQIRAIDFSQTAQEVHNKIRGLSPWPGASCTIGDVELKVFESRIEHGVGAAGMVLTADKDNGLIIACGKSAVRLTTVQRAGKKAMTDTELLNSVSFETAQAATSESGCGCGSKPKRTCKCGKGDGSCKEKIAEKRALKAARLAAEGKELPPEKPKKGCCGSGCGCKAGKHSED